MTTTDDRPDVKPDVKADNNVGGDVTGSVVAGVVDTVQIFHRSTKVELFGRQVSEAELDNVRKQWQIPERFERAESVLAGGNVVVLAGVGTGRTFAAQRLLADRACTRIVHLNPERPMRSVEKADLVSGDGYVWDLSEQGAQAFRAADFEHVRQLIRGVGECWLVVLLDGRTQAPYAAEGLVVELLPPSALAVAEAEVDRRWSGETGDPHQVLMEDFRELLPADIAPEKALLAADLAMRVAEGDLTVAEAVEEFQVGFDRQIENIMADSWESIEFTLMFTIALLQNEPFDEVVALARELDDMVRTHELKAGKALRPRASFVKPHDQLLRTLRARIERRDNPRHKGLLVDTVEFDRTGWAEPVLCRIWQQYHVDHYLLLNWMCGPTMAKDHFGASVWALCTLITKVAAGNRLRELDHLVSRGGFSNFRLAAVTLARLEDEHGYRNLVAETLADWTEKPSSYRKCTTVIYHGQRFTRSDPWQVLAKIGEIGRDPALSVWNAVVGMMLGLMAIDTAGIVLPTVVSWAADAKSVRDEDGLRPAALEIGVYALRLTPNTQKLRLDVDPVALAADHPGQCHRLAWQIAEDDLHGARLIRDLFRLTDWHGFVAEDETARENTAELLRIVRLLAPDLSWRRRRRVVARLCRRHPTLRQPIRRILRVARKADRSGLCDEPDDR